MVLSHDCGDVTFYNPEKECLQKSFYPGIVALIADCTLKPSTQSVTDA